MLSTFNIGYYNLNNFKELSNICYFKLFTTECEITASKNIRKKLEQ